MIGINQRNLQLVGPLAFCAWELSFRLAVSLRCDRSVSSSKLVLSVIDCVLSYVVSGYLG